MNTKEIFNKYFKGKPAFDDLEKATFAYHFKSRDNASAHSFRNTVGSLGINILSASDYTYNKLKNEKCEWCGRSRRSIRFDELPAACSARPKEANLSIAETLRNEETNYFALLERGKEAIPQLINRKFKGKVSAEVLFYCQTTLGYEPDIVSAIMDVDIEQFMPGYETLMDGHRAKS